MYYVCSFSYKYSYKLASFTPKLRFLGAGGKKKSTLISMCNGKRTRSESKSEFVRDFVLTNLELYHEGIGSLNIQKTREGYWDFLAGSQ